MGPSCAIDGPIRLWRLLNAIACDYACLVAAESVRRVVDPVASSADRVGGSPARAPPAGDRLRRLVGDLLLSDLDSRQCAARLHRQGHPLPPSPGPHHDHGVVQEHVPLAGRHPDRRRRPDRASDRAARLYPARGAPAVLGQVGRRLSLVTVERTMDGELQWILRDHPAATALPSGAMPSWPSPLKSARRPASGVLPSAFLVSRCGQGVKPR